MSGLRTALGCLALSACGGAPFTMAEADGASVSPGVDVAAAEDAAPGDGRGSLPDSGAINPDAEGRPFDSANVDAGIDARELDAGGGDVADVGADVGRDAGRVCWHMCSSSCPPSWSACADPLSNGCALGITCCESCP